MHFDIDIDRALSNAFETTVVDSGKAEMMSEHNAALRIYVVGKVSRNSFAGITQKAQSTVRILRSVKHGVTSLIVDDF